MSRPRWQTMILFTAIFSVIATFIMVLVVASSGN